MPPADLTCPDLFYWALEQDARPIGQAFHRLNVRARHDLTFEFVKLTMTVVAGGGDESAVREIGCVRQEVGNPSANPFVPDWFDDVEVSTEEPVVSFPSDRYFVCTPVEMTAGQQYALIVVASGPYPSRRATRYTLTVDYRVEGQARSVTFDHDSRGAFVVGEIAQGAGYRAPAFILDQREGRGFVLQPGTCGLNPCRP